MKFEYVEIQNFKSFEKEVIYLEDFNVFIGANASGKSNSVEIFKFIGNLFKHGVESTISLHGGFENILNSKIGKAKPLKIKFKISFHNDNLTQNFQNKNQLQLMDITSEFEVNAKKRGTGYFLTNEIIESNYIQVDLGKKNEIVKLHFDKTYKNTFRRLKKITRVFENNTDYKNEELHFNISEQFLNSVVSKNELMISEIDWILMPFLYTKNLIKYYDFDPKLMKKSASFIESKFLDEDGSNIAFVLRDILRNKSNKKKFVSFAKDVLPFFEEINTNDNFDKSISYKIKENTSSKSYYANFLSDGTVNIIALIIILFFDTDKGLIIVEEPERNLHPKLMDRIVQMATSTIETKQVIFTTHNPEILKYVDMKNIQYVCRDKEGYTRIKKAVELENVKMLLSDEIRIEDLFIDDLMV